MRFPTFPPSYPEIQSQSKEDIFKIHAVTFPHKISDSPEY